jgi:hypothetical protein
MELDPSASKADHEAAIAAFLIEQDSTFGAILAPLLAFKGLEGLTDVDRRHIRADIAAKVRAALDAEGEPA